MPKGVYFKTEEHRANITKTNFNREYWKKFFQPFQIGVALYE